MLKDKRTAGGGKLVFCFRLLAWFETMQGTVVRSYYCCCAIRSVTQLELPEIDICIGYFLPLCLCPSGFGWLVRRTLFTIADSSDSRRSGASGQVWSPDLLGKVYGKTISKWEVGTFSRQQTNEKGADNFNICDLPFQLWQKGGAYGQRWIPTLARGRRISESLASVFYMPANESCAPELPKGEEFGRICARPLALE